MHVQDAKNVTSLEGLSWSLSLNSRVAIYAVGKQPTHTRGPQVARFVVVIINRLIHGLERQKVECTRTTTTKDILSDNLLNNN
jgi:hypothetical protein